MSSETGKFAGRRFAWAALASLLVLGGIALLMRRASHDGHGAPASPQPSSERLVSLSPAVTETLFALGADSLVVGVSNFCRSPEAARQKPAVGTALTPAYEAIARLEPTLILASEVGGQQLKPLAELAPTESLPWLTLEEVVQSTRRLGKLTHQIERGRELAGKLDRELSRPAPPNAPSVLLALSAENTGSAEIWFLRKNSLHGAALRAAGGRNAVASEVRGAPRLSVEELLGLDPDLVIVVAEPSPADSRKESGPAADAHIRERLLAPFRRLTALRAVREGRLGVVVRPGALGVGPSILDLVDPLRHEITRLRNLP